MKFKTDNPSLPNINVMQHNLKSYDMIALRQEMTHV